MIRKRTRRSSRRTRPDRPSSPRSCPAPTSTTGTCDPSRLSAPGGKASRGQDQQEGKRPAENSKEAAHSGPPRSRQPRRRQPLKVNAICKKACPKSHHRLKRAQTQTASNEIGSSLEGGQPLKMKPDGQGRKQKVHGKDLRHRWWKGLCKHVLNICNLCWQQRSAMQAHHGQTIVFRNAHHKQFVVSCLTHPTLVQVRKQS